MKNLLRISLPQKSDVTPAMREYAEALIPQISDALNGNETIQDVHIVVKVRNNGMQKVELTIITEKNTYRREISGNDYYEILPSAFNELEKSIYKHREIKETRKKRNGKRKKFYNNAPTPKEEIKEEPLVKFKKVDRVQMSVEAAIENLEKVGHDFFLFDDAATGEAKVIYHREDGGYGVLY